MGSATTDRPRLLLSYGASLITIADKAFQRVEDFNGPVGSLARTLASMASPVVRPLQHQWLSLLSFIDDQILTTEDLIMCVFPLSAHFFAKIDELSLFADSLPKRFDDTIDALTTLMHQLPLFDWASRTQSAALQTLSDVISDYNARDEGETVVGIKCNEQLKHQEEGKEREDAAAEGLYAKEVKRQAKKMEDVKEVEKNYAEIMTALESIGIGVEEGVDDIDVGKIDRRKGKKAGAQLQDSEVEEMVRDPILRLFDESWQLKPLKAKKGR